ncbi:MAG: hypothetical protein ACOC44_17295 [Promethearchaeia archaeon]
MPRKITVFLKSVGRKWFIFLLVIILIVFIYNQELAIWLTVIAIILILLSYVPELLFSTKLTRFMKKYYMIEDDTVAQELERPLREVRQKMYELSQDLGKKDYVIVFLNKRYIFYHGTTIERFNELYAEGKNEKEILEELKPFDLRTRAEVKAIKQTLKKFDRLD